MTIQLFATDLQDWQPVLEAYGLLEVPASLSCEQQESQERAIFDQSRELGLKRQASEGRPMTSSELSQALTQSHLPCIGGQWSLLEGQSDVWELRRSPCQTLASGYCHLWREALDGLVMGAGDTLRYSRHHHFTAGECVDLIYDLENSPHGRWAAVPESLQNRLQPLMKQLEETQAGLKLQGYAENTLYCQIEDLHPQLSGHRYAPLLDSIQRFMSRVAPEVRLREMSPQAVWAGD